MSNRPEGYALSAYVATVICRAITKAVMCPIYGYRWKGTRYVPDSGAFLLAPNHQSFLDPPLVGVPLSHRRFCYVASKKYFKVPILGPMMRVMGGFPIDLTARFDRTAWRMCIRTLELGWGMVVFPEGTRSPTRGLRPLQPGVARMALQTGASIIPVAVTGVHDIWPPGRRWPRLRGQITIKYYRPIRVPKCKDRAHISEMAGEITQQIQRTLDRRLRAHARWLRMRGKLNDAPESSAAQNI